jgi:hypothetical protein
MPYSSVSGTWSPLSSLGGRHPALPGGDDARRRVEAGQGGPQAQHGPGVDQIGLVEHDDIGELDLVHEEIADRARVVLVLVQAALGQPVAAGQFGEEAGGVDDGDHGVEAGEVAEGGAVFAGEGEGGGDRHRLGDAAGLDQQVVEAALAGQPRDLLQQVLAQGAADAPVGHLDQPLLGAGERRAAAADERGVDVDLAHVIDDDGHAQTVPIAQDVVEQSGLARAEESGEHGDGQPGVRHGRSVLRVDQAEPDGLHQAARHLVHRAVDGDGHQ